MSNTPYMLHAHAVQFSMMAWKLGGVQRFLPRSYSILFLLLMIAT